MAYARLSDATDGVPSKQDATSFLEGVASHKEFWDLRWAAASAGDTSLAGFAAGSSAPIIPFAFHGGQLFVQAFLHPATPYPRVLLFWQTGSGKTLAVVAVAQNFIRRYRRVATLGRPAPGVFVVAAPGVRSLVVGELLDRPELGYISRDEYGELRRVRAAAVDAPQDVKKRTHLSALLGALKQRVTNRARGGLFRFFGYQELANALLRLTPAGAAKRLTIERLLSLDDDAPPQGSETEQVLEKIRAAVAGGDVVLDEDLLNEFNGGLLIVDEAQNVYNMQATNNYGAVIGFILRALPAHETPRALFLSATPMTGSAAEAVDLISLLRGGTPLRRSDFFARTGTVWRLRPGAAQTLGRLAAGRVSALLDPGRSEYPRVIERGAPLPDIPYLRFTTAPPSVLQARAFGTFTGGTIPIDSAGLVDAAFPAPPSVGAAKTKTKVAETTETEAAETTLGSVPWVRGDPAQAYLGAPPAWLKAAGFEVVRAEGIPPVVGGVALALPTGKSRASSARYDLERLSPKYAALVRECIEDLKARKKTIIYHDRVKGTGVLFLAEVLKANGFVPEGGVVGPNAICSACGAVRAKHETSKASSDHTFTPARFATAHYLIDWASIQRSFDRFNAPTNVDGSAISILLGARLIGVGWTFTAVSFLKIVSLPINIPGLIQVRGRIVRRGTHAALPPEDRTVTMSLFVAEGSPEVARYREKARLFLEVQEIERELRAGAVDAIPQLAEIVARGSSSPGDSDLLGDEKSSSLSGRGYQPWGSAPTTRSRITYDAMGFGDRDAGLVASALAALFQVRPVWTFGDLLAALRKRGSVGRFALADVDSDLVALALEDAVTQKLIVVASEFYLRADVAGVGTYLTAKKATGTVAIRIGEGFDGRSSASRQKAFRAWFLKRPSPPPITFVATEPVEFQLMLLRTIVEGQTGKDLLVEPFADLYRQFRVLIYESRGGAARYTTDGKAGSRPVGFLAADAAHIFAGKQWISVLRREVALAPATSSADGRPPPPENDIIVGFSESRRGILWFKVRQPMHSFHVSVGTGGVTDARILARGGVCATRTRTDIEKALAATTRELEEGGGPQRAGASVPALCLALLTNLLTLEALERKRGRPRVRWVYLFNDRLPTLAELAGRVSV